MHTEGKMMLSLDQYVIGCCTRLKTSYYTLVMHLSMLSSGGQAGKGFDIFLKKIVKIHTQGTTIGQKMVIFPHLGLRKFVIVDS